MQKELRLEGIRELEDLIIEGTNCNVMRGKLDQKSSHFEVDWAMGRDIRKVIVKPNMVRLILLPVNFAGVKARFLIFLQHISV